HHTFHLLLRGDIQLQIGCAVQLTDRFGFHRGYDNLIRGAANKELGHLLSEQSIAANNQHSFYTHRRLSSSATDAEVLSSLYFMILGVARESCSFLAHSVASERLPGTTTTFSGMISGLAPCFR